jgi:DNA-binding NarL/FixJ family response regulator
MANVNRLGVVCLDPMRVLGLEAIFCDRTDLEVVTLSNTGALNDASLSIVVIDAVTTDHLFELLDTFRRARPRLRLIVMGAESDHAYIQKVIGAGAKGYLSHTAREDEIRMAVHIVEDGSVWAPRKVMARLLEGTAERLKEAKAKPHITGRESEVLRLLVAGHPNREIARSLGINPATVKGHVGRLMRKMGVDNRISLSVQVVNEYMLESKRDMGARPTAQ